MEAEVEDAFARLRRQVRLIAQLAGLVMCDRCDGSGDCEREVCGGGWERHDCYFCEGAGFKKEPDNG